MGRALTGLEKALRMQICFTEMESGSIRSIPYDLQITSITFPGS